jgi:hypothetical protein
MGNFKIEFIPFNPTNTNINNPTLLYTGQDTLVDVNTGSSGGESIDEGNGEGEDDVGIFACAKCRCHLSRSSDLMSKDFRGRSGRAYLFTSVINFIAGVPEDRVLMTGKHTLTDISCMNCSEVIGWHYLHAYNESQRYKVGKFILERALVVKINTTTAATTTTTTNATSNNNNIST